MYDVIVIGAGPCGAVAAGTLAKNGRRVLLLEKCKLPRYKSCSGILIEKSLRFIERELGCGVPESVTCTPAQNKGMVFTDDAGREYRFESRGLNIWRDKFDMWLTALAQEAGATVCGESAVTAVEGGDTLSVSVNGRTEEARFVIDCSGAVGTEKGGHTNVITYQTYNRGRVNLDAHYFYAYLQPELSGYDAWFNVKDGMLVLGVASCGAQELKGYYGKFLDFMKEKHGLSLDEQIRTDKWIIRRVQPPFEIDYGSGGVLKAGENAGFLNPMGEGISCALESGRFAALAILSHFKDREKALEEYRQSTAETKNYMRRQWQLVGKLSKKFSFMDE